MMLAASRPVRALASRLACAAALMAATGIGSPVRAQVEPNDPACRDPAFMAGALEAIKLKMDSLTEPTDVSRRMVANGLADARLENPQAASKGPDFLGCNYDIVVGDDRMRMFAKQSTEGGTVTWLSFPAF